MATTYDAVFNEVINAIKLCQETQTTIIAAITSGNGNVTPLAGGDIVDAVYAMDTLFHHAKDADPNPMRMRSIFISARPATEPIMSTEPPAAVANAMIIQ